jgi:hypothetical protein
MSLDLVWFGQDGYFPNQQALKSFIAKREVILNQTEVDSILIVDRADKYLWPARSVVTPLRQSQTYAALPTMLGLRSVYYFGITLPISDINYLNTTVLPPLGARIDRVLTFQDESLYQFTKIVASD